MPVISSVVFVFDGPDQEYVYGVVPPVVVRLMDPVEVPAQEGFVALSVESAKLHAVEKVGPTEKSR